MEQPGGQSNAFAEWFDENIDGLLNGILTDVSR